MAGPKNIGKYEILDEIGRGGFAIVYKARDPDLDRVVALKVLAPHLTWDPTFAERFRREAQATAKLSHPHIVTIYEVGQDGERLYIAMQYLPGHTLASLLGTEDAMPLDRALPILEQVADALDYAHGQGVIHRDVKPRNVMVEETERGARATLMDFGLVKAMESSESLTSAGTILGSPEYMAPEQADPDRRDEIGPATDRYALGVVAYHMLTGRVPFPGSTPSTLVAHMQKIPPDPQSIRENLPEGAARTLLKALAKAPGERYLTGRAMVEALRQAEKDAAVAKWEKEATRERPLAPRRFPVWVWGVAGALVLALCVVGVLLRSGLGGKPAPEPRTTTIAAYGPTDTPIGTDTPVAAPAATATQPVVVGPTKTPTPRVVATDIPSPTGTLAATATPTPSHTFTPPPAETPTPTDTPHPLPTSTPALLFDRYHNDLSLDFSGLQSIFESNGYTVVESDAPLNDSLLSSYDAVVLVVCTTSTNPFTTAEAQAIEDYVASGGDLLMVPYTHLGPTGNTVLSHFDLQAESIWDQDVISITNLSPHAVTYGLSSLDGDFYPGDLFTIIGPRATALAWDYQDRVALAVSELELGKAVFWGEANFIAGSSLSGDAAQFVDNIADWFLGTATPTPALAAGATRVWEADDSVMVYVPAGKFWMGSTDKDIDAILAECSDCKREWFGDEKPQHEVYLDAFWIDRTEVTNGQYQLCVEDGACRSPSDSGSHTRDSYYGNPEFDNYPVIYVSWSQAEAYCAWAGKRLPTEAEWEKAARGTNKGTYPWGEGIDCWRANYWGRDGGCMGDTTAVGSYPTGVSAYGALDMAGNVWEWTSSLYEPYPYDEEDGREDPVAAGGRVVRGGTWNTDQRVVRLSDRYNLGPWGAVVNVGFRCARSGSGP